MKEPKLWNSLEIAKLVASLLTPILILWFSIMANDKLNHYTEAESNNERIFNHRADIYNQIGPSLNDFYCYITYLGHWKSLKPDDLIKANGEIEKIMYTNRPLFDKEFFDSYRNFLSKVFEVDLRVEKDIKLKTDYELHRKYASDSIKQNWKPEWHHLFAKPEELKDVHVAYYDFLEQLANQLDLKVDYNHIKRNEVPIGLGK